MSFRKKVYAAAGYNTIYMGSGRREFDPSRPMRPFTEYLAETAQGTSIQIPQLIFDEGIIGSFMSGRFLKQANLPGFLPYMSPSLVGKPCTGIEGACGTGGRAIAAAIRSILSDLADVVFVAGFEMQNTMKAVYGSDVLAGAAYYQKERKQGCSFFFPGIFAERAEAYFKKYGEAAVRPAMAKWYEQSILNARKNPKAQEFHNANKNLFDLGMTPPNPKQFIPFLNAYDCSKVTDGASSIVLVSEEGLKKCGIDVRAAIEIIGLGEAEADITLPPEDLTALTTTKVAVQKSFAQAKIEKEDLAILELHDCFTITALLALEALGYAEKGKAMDFILEGKTAADGILPVNLSGGLIGFGHPTGATGIRQLVDLHQQLTGQAPYQAALKKPFGLMISMGGNDKTVTCILVRKPEC